MNESSSILNEWINRSDEYLTHHFPNLNINIRKLSKENEEIKSLRNKLIAVIISELTHDEDEKYCRFFSLIIKSILNKYHDKNLNDELHDFYYDKVDIAFHQSNLIGIDEIMYNNVRIFLRIKESNNYEDEKITENDIISNFSYIRFMMLPVHSSETGKKDRGKFLKEKTENLIHLKWKDDLNIDQITEYMGVKYLSLIVKDYC